MADDNGLLGPGDEVRLVVPAAPEYLRVVRLTASALASRLGFTYDDVEDLRIAVDELCALLVGGGGPEESVRLRMSSADDGIIIEGIGPAGPDGEPEPSDLSRQILGAVADDYEVAVDGADARFRLYKRRESR
jgi:serine/threonine-protein kinase RsbW